MLNLSVNGSDLQLEAPADMPLLWVIRDLLGLKGTKYGCGIGQCGACTVLVDGQAQRSCVVPAAAVQGQSITTIEGLDSEAGRAVMAAWEALAVPQCGYCQSGQILAAAGLLNGTPNPSDSEIAGRLAGNLCRCCTYQRIRRAVRRAAEELAAAGGGS